ncbi:MAG: XcyI family restriction endonuclease [Verrucomicrobiota bacterium]|jgi:hypothetical protein
MSINLPSSSLQASIASELQEIRKLFLQQALAEAVQRLDLRTINAELDQLVPQKHLAQLASRGIRGELLFAVPCLLRANPRLLGYYRLLLGFSQKEFYNKSKLARLAVMETKGELSSRVAGELDELCGALVTRASEMADRIGFGRITKELLDDLTLLTLGPQLRGSRNTRIGKAANEAVFKIIQNIVGHSLSKSTTTNFVLNNAAGRQVTIAFSADPDISISEDISSNTTKSIVAIEIKGGADKSNIWNRLGEAEKSHQSAKQRGFVEFWTIYNVPDLDLPKAKEKSPTTTRFYSLLQLTDRKSDAFVDFRDRLISLVGIRAAPAARRGN